MRDWYTSAPTENMKLCTFTGVDRTERNLYTIKPMIVNIQEKYTLTYAQKQSTLEIIH